MKQLEKSKSSETRLNLLENVLSAFPSEYGAVIQHEKRPNHYCTFALLPPTNLASLIIALYAKAISLNWVLAEHKSQY